MEPNVIGKRIREVRKNQGLTQAEFGAQIGIKGNTVTGYENGTRRPSDAIINSICLVFGVDQTWLRTGEGEMYIPAPDVGGALQGLFTDYNCNALEMSFLSAYFGLSVMERKAFCEVISKMFPDAISKIVGADPLCPFFQEAPPLVEDDRDEKTVETLCEEVRRQLGDEKEAGGASEAS